jgi:DGQHR domain-containing protein
MTFRPRVLEPHKTDLELSEFARLSAIKGNQFDRDVYTTVLKFKDLHTFLATFSNVQRNINPRKVASLKRYIISGLENDKELNMRFFSAITVTCRGTIYYDESRNGMAVDVNQTKLSINDGQHRCEAVNQTIAFLESEFVKSKDKHKSSRLQSQIEKLSNMVFPIVIFDGLTEKEEKQLFHDLNNLAQRPSRSANIRLNQKDLFSKMAREISEENRYLRHYGIEYDKMSIQRGNDNSILLTTIYEMIKEILGAEYNRNRNFLQQENYETFKQYVADTFEKIFFALPPDLEVRGKYLIEKSYTLKSIAKFICHARSHLDLMMSDELIFNTIEKVDWHMNVDYWSKFGGTLGVRESHIIFNGGVHGGIKAVYRALIMEATKELNRKR